MFRFNRIVPPGVVRLGAVLLFACTSVGAAPALAAWPLESAARITLGYGDTYVRDGRSVSHRGVDLEGEAGVAVLAPASGVVSFVGRVPATPGTMLALTITTDDGMLVTLSPLSGAQVVAGERVDLGGLIGHIAESGDPSTATPHLHVSARRGDCYLDPGPLLGSPPAVALATLPIGEPQTPAVPTTQVLPKAEVSPDAIAQSAVQETAGASSVAVSHAFTQMQAPAPASIKGVAPSASTQALEPTSIRAAPSSLQSGGESGVARLNTSNTSPHEFRASHGPGRVHGSFTTWRSGRSTGAIGLLAVGALAMWPLWRRRGSCGPDVTGRFHHVATAVAR